MAGIVDKQDLPQSGETELSGAATILQQTADQNTAARSVSETVCTLQLLYSGRIGGMIEAPRILHAESTTLGRNPQATAICLADDDRVSRLHATVFRGSNPGDCRIVDSGSRHGVFVNGTRIEEHTLKDGDVIRIGNSFLLFRVTSTVSSDGLASLSPHPATAGLLGTSLAICALRHTIGQIGPTDSSVMLLGESGTGKEVTAKALHSLSPRARNPFIAVNCSAIPESLADSLLFGHEKGAFTGADRLQEGYFRAAHNGTLFLDEVGELPRAIQPKLLRAIEERQVLPVGASRSVAVNVRIIAATNRNVIEEINSGEFRGDLFFRLADLTIRLPPLRERREDILPILLSQWEKGSPRFTPDLVEALLLHPWPYNVRELLKIAKELQVKGHDRSELDVDLVSERLAMGEQLHSHGQDPLVRSTPSAPTNSDSQIPSRDELIDLLRRHKCNISAIAREKNRSRTQVERWLEARGINKDHL